MAGGERGSVDRVVEMGVPDEDACHLPRRGRVGVQHGLVRERFAPQQQ